MVKEVWKYLILGLTARGRRGDVGMFASPALGYTGSSGSKENCVAGYLLCMVGVMQDVKEPPEELRFR
jgi:hypothetical protein